MMQAFCSVSVCNAAVFLYVTAQRAAAERCTPFEGSASIIQCFHIKHHSLLLLHVACLYWRVTDTEPRFTHSSSKFKCCRGDSIYHWADIVKKYIAYLEFNMKNKHLNFSMPKCVLEYSRRFVPAALQPLFSLSKVIWKSEPSRWVWGAEGCRRGDDTARFK